MPFMGEDEKVKPDKHRLEWKDYISFIIALLSTSLLPIIIFIIIFILLAIIIGAILVSS
jgi:hypothetical protein